MFASDLWQVGCFFRVLWFPPTINLRLRYNWDIIESGAEHYNPNANPIIKRNNVYTKYLFVCDISAFDYANIVSFAWLCNILHFNDAYFD